MSLHSSNRWLQNSWTTHISVHRQEDGSFRAESPHGKLEATGRDEAEAIRTLRGKLMDSAMKGNL